MKAVAHYMKRIDHWAVMLMWKHAHRHVDCLRKILYAPVTIAHSRIHFRQFARPAAICNIFAKKLAAHAEIRYKRVAIEYAKCKNHWKPHRWLNVTSFLPAAAIYAHIDPNIIWSAQDHTIDVGFTVLFFFFRTYLVLLVFSLHIDQYLLFFFYFFYILFVNLTTLS